MSHHEGQTRTAMARCPSIIAKKKCKKITLIKPPNQCETLVGLKNGHLNFLTLKSWNGHRLTAHHKPDEEDSQGSTRTMILEKTWPCDVLQVLGKPKASKKLPARRKLRMLREGEYFRLQTKKGCKMLQQTSCWEIICWEGRRLSAETHHFVRVPDLSTGRFFRSRYKSIIRLRLKIGFVDESTGRDWRPQKC